MSASIIILNYNNAEETAEYVERICEYKCLDHVIIVDNASTDGSAVRLKPLCTGKVELVKSGENRGYAAGNNLGLRYVCDKYGTHGVAIISNPDIIVSEASVENILKAFSGREELFAVTGLVYNRYGKQIPLITWRIPTAGMLLAESSVWLRKLLWALFKYGKRYTREELTPKEAFIKGDALPGCFFAADIEKFAGMGFFSESTFLFYEEEILFAEAKRRGYVSGVATDSSLIHNEGTTIRKLNSWYKREKLMEDSCTVYMRESLHKGNGLCTLYRVWNRICVPERYLAEKLRRMKAGK